MHSDYFTKPVQGNLFNKLHSVLTNIDPSSPYGWRDQRSVLEHEQEPNLGVRRTYLESVTQGPRIVEVVNGKVATAAPQQLTSSSNLE